MFNNKVVTIFGCEKIGAIVIKKLGAIAKEINMEILVKPFGIN